MRGDLKISPRLMIAAHRKTYISARDGRPRWQDRALFEWSSIAVFVACVAFDVKLSGSATVALLAAATLLSVFLFGVMLQVSERAMDWADTAPPQGRDTSAHAQYLEELAANSGYASLVCIAALIAFIVASASAGWELRISSAVGLMLGAHLLLVLLMVMKRVFALTQERLTRARTGADRDPNPVRNIARGR